MEVIVDATPLRGVASGRAILMDVWRNATRSIAPARTTMKPKLCLCAEDRLLIKPLPLLNFFVAVVMFSIGLRTSGREFLNVVRDRALLARTLLANCIVIPALGFLLVHTFPLNHDATIGILLLAAIPGTPIALQFTRMAKTRLAFAAAMTFVLSLVSIAMTPLAIEAMQQIAPRNERPVLILIATIALYIALPLWVGLWVAQGLPKVASRLVVPMSLIATVAFLFLMWETRLVRRQAFNAIRGGGTVLAMFLLLLVSMLIGWLIGGPDRETRRILATSTGMRSVIVVLYMARYCFPSSNVFMVPIVYLSLMVPTNLLFHLVFTGFQRLRPAKVPDPNVPSLPRHLM
jgi:predicted Na+-dependent transporter